MTTQIHNRMQGWCTVYLIERDFGDPNRKDTDHIEIPIFGEITPVTSDKTLKGSQVVYQVVCIHP